MKNTRTPSLYPHPVPFMNRLRERLSKQKCTRLDNTDKIFSILIKANVFAPVLGGGLLLRYLYSIGKPSLFMPSVSSLNGFFALLLGGILSCFAFTFLLLLPYWIARLAFHEHTKIFPSAVIPRFRILFLFLAFPVMFIAYAYETIPGLLLFVSILIFSLIVLFPIEQYSSATQPLKGWRSITSLIENHLKRVWRSITSLKSNFLKGVWHGICLYITNHLYPLVLLVPAVFILVLPYHVILNLSTSRGVEEWIIISLLILWSFLTSAMLVMQFRSKDWKSEGRIFGIIALFMLLYFHLDISVGAAKILSIRNENKEWYWVDNIKKIKPILPNSLCQFSYEEGAYIYAAKQFMFGNTIVLCTTGSANPCKDNSKDEKTTLDHCAILDSSEVRVTDKPDGIIDLSRMR
jgi:hypothetical protein